jgi:ribose/xylose/arabinose/galactoside ABC-type transport system permease subunit
MVVDSSAGWVGNPRDALPTMMLRGLSQERIVLVLLLTLAILFVLSLVLPGFGTVANRLNLVRSISTLGVMGLAMGSSSSAAASTSAWSALCAAPGRFRWLRTGARCRFPEPHAVLGMSEYCDLIAEDRPISMALGR